MKTFDKNIKLYVFKKDWKVSLSIKISDSYVQEYIFTCDDFDKIVDGWYKGISTKLGPYHVCIEHKDRTARPERIPCSFVRFSVSCNNVSNHHRISYDDMVALTKDYFYQSNNVMFWDE